MDRIYVSSTDLRSVGYDEATMTLEVEFRSGGVYLYSHIPASLYQDLMRASSKGSYFHAYIRDKYPTTRIR